MGYLFTEIGLTKHKLVDQLTFIHIEMGSTNLTETILTNRLMMCTRMDLTGYNCITKEGSKTKAQGLEHQEDW